MMFLPPIKSKGMLYHSVRIFDLIINESWRFIINVYGAMGPVSTH